MKLAAALVLLAPFSVQADGPTATQDPAPLSAVEGIAGFATVSRVVFTEAPEAPHRLEAVYLFPDRARWRLIAIGGRPFERKVVYRYGARAYELPPKASSSRELTDRDRDSALLQMELRRAALFWPDGFDWEESAPHPSVPERLAFAPVYRGTKQIGSLKATLDRKGRATHIVTSGDFTEALGIERWQEMQKRSWPKELVLYKDGDEVWRETLEEVETRVYYIDAFFQPPDRRPAATTSPEEPAILSLDLQGITFQTKKLPRGSKWDKALAKTEGWMDQAARKLSSSGLEVERVPTLELADDGRPVRAILRLASRQDDPPKGWTTLPDRPGLAMVLPDLSALTAAHILGLRAACPADARAGTPYCRITTRSDGGEQVQLYLPLEPLDTR